MIVHTSSSHFILMMQSTFFFIRCVLITPIVLSVEITCSFILLEIRNTCRYNVSQKSYILVQKCVMALLE